MSNIVNINGKNFLNDYIDFDCKDYSEYRYGARSDWRNYPESKCLVHIWQNSNDLMDFWDNMVSAHDYWLKQVSRHPTWKLPLNTRGYIDHIKSLRYSGVKLKTYKNEHMSIARIIQTRELNKIAMITVT